jgi:hypothetical protein
MVEDAPSVDFDKNEGLRGVSEVVVGSAFDSVGTQVCVQDGDYFAELGLGRKMS